VLENGGATYICPDSIGVVAKHLHDSPEGVTPYIARRGEEDNFYEFQWFCEQTKNAEKKTLKELGVDSLPDWKIRGEREILKPYRETIHARMKELELRRLAGEKVGPSTDTGVEVHREIVTGLLQKRSNITMTALENLRDGFSLDDGISQLSSTREDS
jgi:hypothetical protein